MLLPFTNACIESFKTLFHFFVSALNLEITQRLTIFVIAKIKIKKCEYNFFHIFKITFCFFVQIGFEFEVVYLVPFKFKRINIKKRPALLLTDSNNQGFHTTMDSCPLACVINAPTTC